MTASKLSRLVLLSSLWAAFAALNACGQTDSSVGSFAGAVDGEDCDDEGATGEARDGCNTCSCSDGTWVCTDIACAQCQPGATRLADDGCNQCTCSDGQWACTDMACAECADGDTKLADDGCNQCTCSGGQWACTDAACTACQNGAMRPADDGCNTCTCLEGTWECTLIGCPSCPPPRDPDPDVSCPAVNVWAKDPMSATCCDYSDPCHSPLEWETFFDEETCLAAE